MAKIIFGKHRILYEFEYQQMITKIDLKCGFETVLDNICMSINSVRNMLSHQCSLVKLC